MSELLASSETHAISIRQPWAWLIANGFKDIENRDWATKFRGDGSVFDAIEVGSTGIHDCYYEGKWPAGSWWVRDSDGDLWPSRPMMFRLKQAS